MVADKILVTGGAGFIGSHVVDLYVSNGYEVVVVDSLVTGRREHVNRQARLYDIDLRDPRLSKIFRDERPRFVCHHAAQASVQTSVREPAIDADVNVIGSLRLLDLCREHEAEKFIYISSGGAIYGEPESLPCGEEHPIRPLSPYGVSKAVVESYLSIFRNLWGLNYSVLRYANVYGPRQDPHGEAGVVSIFTDKMLRKERATINGMGEQQRDFVYVEDVAQANLLCLGSGNRQAYNIGSGKGTSVNEIFQRLKSLTGNVLSPNYGPPKEGEVFQIYLNIEKAKTGLGWSPKIGLQEGLSRTVEHMIARAKGTRP